MCSWRKESRACWRPGSPQSDPPKHFIHPIPPKPHPNPTPPCHCASSPASDKWCYSLQTEEINEQTNWEQPRSPTFLTQIINTHSDNSNDLGPTLGPTKHITRCITIIAHKRQALFEVSILCWSHRQENWDFTRCNNFLQVTQFAEMDLN